MNIATTMHAALRTVADTAGLVGADLKATGLLGGTTGRAITVAQATRLEQAFDVLQGARKLLTQAQNLPGDAAALRAIGTARTGIDSVIDGIKFLDGANLAAHMKHLGTRLEQVQRGLR